MQTPLEPKADPDLGPTAGPAFLYRSRDAAALAAEAERLLGHPPKLGTSYEQAWTAALSAAHDELRALTAVTS
jgi:hypothetical protein